jgi:mRNA-degrading endonuclease RelE of RelBE toxin-antitoxin system
MSISANNDRLTIIISKSVKDELKKLADSENRSLSNYVVNILEKHVDNSK